MMFPPNKRSVTASKNTQKICEVSEVLGNI